VIAVCGHHAHWREKKKRTNERTHRNHKSQNFQWFPIVRKEEEENMKWRRKKKQKTCALEAD
jgi:hypothetical protein